MERAVTIMGPLVITVAVIRSRETPLYLVIPAKFREAGREPGSRREGEAGIFWIPELVRGGLGSQERPRPE
jgi:hypothetical protein